MSLKDNFNQAVKEILKKDGLVGSDLSKGSKQKSDIDKMLGSAEAAMPERGTVKGGSLIPDPEVSYGTEQSYGTNYSGLQSSEPASPSAEDFQRAVQNQQSIDPFAEGSSPEYTPPPAPAPAPAPAPEYEMPRQEYASREASYPPPSPAPYTGRSYGSSRGSSPFGGVNTSPLRGGRPPETPYYETEETTIISRNTRINGDINSFANVNIDGSVQGDIKLTKDISVTGKVVGNIECNNATLTGSSMQGSVSSKGQVQMDRDSVLLGDISTQYLDLNGRIKGNVDVGGKAEFKTDAVIMGNITASTISVIDGAVIKGYVNTTFMQESSANIFPEAITVGE
ncbi:MAG: polymer-forming cytoskeletal protein [Huintestinicola sp.]